MNQRWITLLCGTLAVMLLVACNSQGSQMNTYARKGDLDQKDTAAFYYFEQGNYEKAVFLLEELLSVRRNGPRAADYLWTLAEAKLEQSLYISAAFQYETFARRFPLDKRATEAQYKVAYAYDLQSSPYYLDQTYTKKAIDQYQIFINLNPGASQVETATERMSALREKLAKKSYEAARLYLRMSNYRAAVDAFQSFVRTYPDSRYREEAQLAIIEAAVELAEASTKRRQRNRFLDAIDFYTDFVDRYPNSAYIREAENYYARARRGLGRAEADQS